MTKRNEFSLLKVDINHNYKDQLLVELSNLNIVHIKPVEEDKIMEKIEVKDPLEEKIKYLRKNLNDLYRRLEINEFDILRLKTAKDDRIEFISKDLTELIGHIVEEIDFYTNRVIELNGYISKGIIELENLNVIRKCYGYIEILNLNTEKIALLEQFEFRIFTTFSKNLVNLKNLLDPSEFPCIYDSFEISDDRIGFYIFYPKDAESEFNARIRLIHSEEVLVLKKYLTKDGINFLRINKEINFIENMVSRYKKEKTRITQANMVKFAAINEVVQNIEEYNWAEHQFKRKSSNHSSLKFFVPLKKKEEVSQYLFNIFKDNITIESTDISKKKTIEKSLNSKKVKEKIPKKGLKIKKEYIEQIEKGKIPEEDLRESTPTMMKNFFLIRPFETITRLYGTPAYSEIDPTPFIAITFPILFGIMFGDIGHGLILIIAGLIGAIKFGKSKKNSANFAWIIFFCGWASFFVGFLYGEFFGRHEIEIFGKVYLHLQPITIPFLNLTLYNPLGNILTVFYFAIIIGVFHINLGWFIQFLNYWKQNRKYLAFSDSFIKILLLTGGTILLFTFGFDIYGWLSYPYPILLVIIPGILLLVLKPFGKLIGVSYLQQESFKGLLGEGSIETFDTILSVVSNVASYIRLLALALAHIALLYSINVMSDLIKGDNFGIEITNLIGQIFGNLVVILIEGILVFINTLRLHFYEFFFKFYQGTGINYFPFYLDNNYSILTFRTEAERDVISEEIEREIDTQLVKEEINKAINYISKKFE